MIKINLLSEGKRPAAVRRAKGVAGAKQVGQWLMLVCVLAGVLAAAGWWYVLKGRLEEKQQEVRVAQRQVDELQAVIKEVEDFKRKKSELERKIKVINDLKANQRGPVRVMDYISKSLPELLWLDRMNMGPANIEIDGRAFNTNAVANFMDNLDKVPEFKEPTLKDTTEQAAGVYKFAINFDYSFTPPAPKAGEAGAPGAAPPGSGPLGKRGAGGKPGAPGSPGSAGSPGSITAPPPGGPIGSGPGGSSGKPQPPQPISAPAPVSR
ncbi:MAG TPA: PilN domain-containing protein [Thermoanaerobaculia bacterium]|nr:PilN domain-containing protein [Thermoanaerobaculia bacterium]